MMTVGTNSLSGTGASVDFTELRQGTDKEIAAFTSPLWHGTTVASFKYNTDTSSTFSIYPGGSAESCDTSVDEIQYLRPLRTPPLLVVTTR